MVKFVLWVTMCIGNQCSDLSKAFDTAEECRLNAQIILDIIHQNKVDQFVVSCAKKSSI